MSFSGLKHRAVFLDRDGVLVETFHREGKLSSPRALEEFHTFPGIKSSLSKLAAKGFVLIVVTNQPDLARKKMTEAVLEQMNRELISQAGGEKILRALYVCPHTDEDACECRKPKPGMLLRAAEEWKLDLAQSFMVGDQERDVKAGCAAGCRTVLIDAPYNLNILSDYRAKNLNEAVDWILSRS